MVAMSCRRVGGQNPFSGCGHCRKRIRKTQTVSRVAPHFHEHSTMDSPVFITYFDTATRSQFLSSPMQFLGSRTQSKMPVGSIVVLVDLTAGEVFGVVRVRNAPDKLTPCIEHAWLDMDTYSVEYQRYNRYEIHIHEVRILKTPMGFAHICFLVSGDMTNRGNGNMWKRNYINFARPFHVGVNPEVIKRYELVMNMMMG